MGWKEMAKLGREWAEARRTELLTADRRTREDASHRADAVERQAEQEAATSFLEAALPKPLADRVTAARPENVAARETERRHQEEVRRLGRLESQDPATLTLTVTGSEHGSTVIDLPCRRVEEHPDPAEQPFDDGPPPLSWLRVELESPAPVPVGSAALVALGLAVPGYHGPGVYDLVDLHRRGEAGEIGWWEAFDVYLCPTIEADDRTWYLDVSADGGAVIEVTDGGLAFDLPMASALGTIRITGSVAW